MPEFVEFAGKKEYKCPRCKAVIRYAKFFGDDKKVLTTDGEEPYFDRDKKPMSNTGWPTDPITKQMHQCKPKYDRELELKKLDTLLEEREKDNTSESKTDVVHNVKTILSELDKKVMDKIIDDAYHDAQLMIGTLTGVERACKELSIEVGPISGMIFKEVCENIRRRNE